MYSIATRPSLLWKYVWRLATPTCFVVMISSATLALANGGIVSGAPSYSLFGAFFPAWMFCALVGIFGAIAARAAMVISGLAKVLPYQFFVCASIGLDLALVMSLVWFGG